MKIHDKCQDQSSKIFELNRTVELSILILTLSHKLNLKTPQNKMSFEYGKKLLNKDYQYCDLLGNELLKDCLGAYTNEELKNLQEEDWAIIELKRELRNKVGNEEKKLSSGMKPSSASKVDTIIHILYW